MWFGVRNSGGRFWCRPSKPACKQSSGKFERQHQAEVEELEVIPDHVHLLVSVDPQFGIIGW